MPSLHESLKLVLKKLDKVIDELEEVLDEQTEVQSGQLDETTNLLLRAFVLIDKEAQRHAPTL